MLYIEHPARTAARPDDAMPIDMDATLFVALELSLSSWVLAASAPGEDKASKHGVAACDGPGLLALLDRLRQRAEIRRRRPVTIAVVQEAGRDGFWVHRLLEAHGVRSFVVDPSSIAVNRRSRRTSAGLPSASPTEPFGQLRQDGPHRRRGDASDADGLVARRAAGVRDGASTDACGGGRSSAQPRARGITGRAHPACEPDQGAAGHAGRVRL